MKPLSQSKQDLQKTVPPSYLEMTDYELVWFFQHAEKTQRDYALLALTHRHMGALAKNTRAHCGKEWSEDCFLSAWEGMVKGLGKFDLNNPKQVKVITYIYWYMRKGASQWLTGKAREDKNSFRGWTEDISDSLRSYDPDLELVELVTKVQEVINNFPGNQEFIKSFYGLGVKGKNIPSIAKETGVEEKELRNELSAFKLYVRKSNLKSLLQ